MVSEKEFINSRIRTTNFSTIVSMSLVLFFLGLLSYLFITTKSFTNTVKENVAFTFLIKENIEPYQVNLFREELQKQPFVRKIQVISPEQAAQDLQKDLGQDFVEVLGYNPLFSSLDVQLKYDYANPDSLRMLHEKYKKHPIVEEVSYQEPAIVEKINDNLNTFLVLLFGLFVVFLAIALLLINDNIRLATYSKRFLIKSMQLVGATEWFICKPFIINGITNSIIAIVVASSVFYASVFLLEFVLKDLQRFHSDDFIFLACAVIAVIGLSLGSISNYWAVRKYLRTKTQYLF